MFKHVGTNGSLTFDDISPQLTELPSWMESQRGGVNDTQVLSLKPPRMPTGLGQVDAEPVAPANANADDPEEAPSLEDVEVMLGPEPDEPEEVVDHEQPDELRRIDTLIEEIVPRAEEEAISAIRDAVRELVQQRTQVLQSSEEQVIQLVRVISERIVARELHVDPSVICGMVREGLGALTSNDSVTVRVGEFFATVVQQLESEIRRVGVRATVLVDPALGSYGCKIQTEWGSVDESVETRLRTLLEGISIAPPPRS